MKVAVNSIAAALLAFSGVAVADTLVLYTSQPATDAQMTVDAFQKVHPDTKVEWVRDGTTKLMTKLRAEMNSGVAKPDVLLIADSVTLEQLKKKTNCWLINRRKARNMILRCMTTAAITMAPS